MAMHYWKKFGRYSKLRPASTHFLRPRGVRILSACIQVWMINIAVRFYMNTITKPSLPFLHLWTNQTPNQEVSERSYFLLYTNQCLGQYLKYNKFFYSQMEESGQISMKDFDVIKELGAGSFGKVKLVKRKADQTLFALKTVTLSRLNQKEKDGALNQVRLLASIHIPTVIKYEGSFFDTETHELCVLMEFADGGDLQNQIVERENMQPGQGFEQKFVWKVAHQILQGLKSLHKNNIIHRDIKSANIFFVKGVAKLGDMNVSKVAQDGFCSTQTGTPYYTSPQIWSGQKYGNKCDIWSLGCLIYELCTLKVPFKASDFPSLYIKITKGEYSEISSKYSQKLKRFIHMCLTVDEQMRPSAAQLLESSMLKSLDMANDEVKGGEINLVQLIRCPKVLKFLNSRLPKAQNAQNGRRQDCKKKAVNFGSKASDDQQQASKQNTKYRKIRSQKVIQWAEEQQLNAPRNHLVKPSQTDKQMGSQKQISSGLSFSTKKLKVKPTSTKLIMEIGDYRQ